MIKESHIRHFSFSRTYPRLGKHRRTNRVQEASRTAHFPGQFVNADLTGKIPTTSIDGYDYASLLVDRYSSYASILTGSSKTPEFVIQHIKSFQSELIRPIKTLRSDNGTEYINGTVSDFLKDSHIRHETTGTYRPDQNGKVERLSQTLFNTVRSMLNTCKLNDSFWSYALRYAVYIYNRLPNNSNPDSLSPWEHQLKLQSRKRSRLNVPLKPL